jgi:methylmalonyl-CoA mutase cobalamin-binding subunit
MYHMQIGLTSWPATERALGEVEAALAERGHTVDRFGLALDRVMSRKEARRAGIAKETGVRLEADDWARIGEAVAIQPHMGDHMIGSEASFENTLRAMPAGVTTIGNVGHYVSYELVGGSDETEVTEETLRALGALAARRADGALAHSNLDDGPGMQVSHYGAYAGWAALELYVVEELAGARLAHCYGNLVDDPVCRAVLHLALDDLRDRESIGSMVFGNTVGYTADRSRSTAALATQVLTDIALQLHRPTGHAVTPIPLTEAIRIPSPDEIVEVHLLARELEREARAGGALFDWARLERLGAAVADYARRFRDRALRLLEDDGVDIRDAAALLLALRRAGAAELERRVDLTPPLEVGRLEPWKASHVRSIGAAIAARLPRLDGVRIVLGVLEVHDVVRDALARELPAAGAEVVLVGAGATAETAVRAAVEEDADAVVLAVYNGNALALGEQLVAAAAAEGFDGAIVLGGLLNQDLGGELPVDVTDRLTSLGIRCVERAEDLGDVLAAAR